MRGLLPEGDDKESRDFRRHYAGCPLRREDTAPVQPGESAEYQEFLREVEASGAQTWPDTGLPVHRWADGSLQAVTHRPNFESEQAASAEEQSASAATHTSATLVQLLASLLRTP